MQGAGQHVTNLPHGVQSVTWGTMSALGGLHTDATPGAKSPSQAKVYKDARAPRSIRSCRGSSRPVLSHYILT